MAFDLVTAKTRLSITDATQDVELQAALDVSLSLAEKYCNRLFMYASQRATFYHVNSGQVQLRRFPVDVEVAHTPQNAKFHVHKVQGVIIFEEAPMLDEFHFDYSGGYKVLPAELEFALWQIFDRAWSLYTAAAGGGGGSAGAAGAISRITLQDVGSITYANANAAAAGVPDGAGLASGAGVAPFTAISILDLYRLESC